MTYGVVKWFDKSKGYGFISQRSGEDVYVHCSEITEEHKILYEEQSVSFDVSIGSKGLRARNVRVALHKKGSSHKISHINRVPQRADAYNGSPTDWVSKETPLMVAAKENDMPKLMSLLISGANKDSQEKRGLTALMFAAWRGHIEIVKTLLQAGANPYLQTIRRDTAYSLADRKKHRECMELLKETKDIDTKPTSAFSLDSSNTKILTGENHYCPRRLEDSRGLGHMRRDNGQFGSFPKHENYSEESEPYDADNEWYDRINS